MKSKAFGFTLLSFIVVAIIVLGQLSKSEAQEQSDWLIVYCNDAATWAAEEERNVPLNERTGQPDYKGIAEDHCPGMRPAQ